MANLKISELPVAVLPLNADDLVCVVQTGTTSQIPFSGLSYSSSLVSAQQEDFGSGTPLQTISASTAVGSVSIDVSGNKPVLFIASVTYKCVSGTAADSQLQLRRDGTGLGVNSFANIGTTDYYTVSLQQRDPGSIGSPATLVYDLWLEIGTAAEFEIHAYSLTAIEL